MSSDAAIEVDDLGKAYELGPRRTGGETLREALGARLRHPLRRSPTQTFWALQDVSLRIMPGEAVGVIGGNGAGKSTLLKILCRITEPTRGQAILRGRVGSLLEVGTGFHPELTGRENIFLNGAILGMSRAEIQQRFDEIVDFAGTGTFLDTPVKRYSSGMYVRLAFAVAAHLRTEILIVDEVLAVGDVEFQQRCLGKMEEASRDDGRTILFVSHNLAAVEALCTRAICLRQGEVIADGEVTDAIGAYLGRDEEGTGERDLRSTGAAHFRSIALRDGSGAVTREVRMGQPAKLSIRLESLEDPASLLFGVHLRSGGVLVTSISTRMYPTLIADAPDQMLTIEFRALPLTPGTYTVDLGLKRAHEPGFVDFVAHAIAFDISATDVYGTGYLPSQADGLVHLPASMLAARIESGHNGDREATGS